MLILHKTLIYFICQDKKRMEGGYIGVINSDIPYIYVNNVFCRLPDLVMYLSNKASTHGDIYKNKVLLIQNYKI